MAIGDYHLKIDGVEGESPDGVHTNELQLESWSWGCTNSGSSHLGGEQEEFLKIKFTDVLISSYQVGGSAHGDGLPTDQISFNFSKIEFSYAPQKADGTLASAIEKGFDLKTNKIV
jgi:type VI secretion system secreted protein Hcp